MTRDSAFTTDVVHDDELQEIERLISSRLEASRPPLPDARELVDRVRQELDRMIAGTLQVRTVHPTRSP